MGLFEHFPYTNFHSLNIQWAIDKIKELLQQGETLYATLQEWKTNTTAELEADIEAWKTDIYSTFQSLANDSQAAEAAAVTAQLAAETAKTDAERAAASALQDALLITSLSIGLDARKVNKPITSPDGIQGQVLQSLGNGNTVWATPGTPSYADTERAVSKWLEDHPEATTTVSDGSITYLKFAPDEYPFITLEMFGAMGDGETDDTDAIFTALNYAAENNKIVIILSKTYIIESRLNTWDVLIPGGGSLQMIGTGLGATLKRKDNCVPSGAANDQYAMLSVRPAADASGNASLVVKNVTLDGNYRGQADFILGDSSGEACATFRFVGTANCTIDAYFDNIYCLDSIGDAISTGGSNLSGSVRSAYFNRIRGERTHRPFERAEIEFIAYPLYATITNSDIPKIHVEANTDAPDVPVRLEMQNVTCREGLSILGRNADFEIRFCNCTFEDKFTLVKCTGAIINCNFASSTPDTWFVYGPQDLLFKLCKFENGGSVFKFLGTYGGSTVANSRFTLTDCILKATTDTTYLMEIRQSDGALESIVHNCIFESATETAIEYAIFDASWRNITFDGNRASGFNSFMRLHPVSSRRNTAKFTGEMTNLCTYLLSFGTATNDIDFDATIAGSAACTYDASGTYFRNSNLTGGIRTALVDASISFSKAPGWIAGTTIDWPFATIAEPFIVRVINNTIAQPAALPASSDAVAAYASGTPL